jgi:S-adenosylmethionine/arginine decarboxylase-like enzyme
MNVPILRQRLVIEAFGCSNLNSIDAAYDFLVSVADAIGVTLYSQPIVVKTPGQGLTGIAVLLESAEVLHTWPEFGFADFYIESCKAFDKDIVCSILNKFFSPVKLSIVIDSTLQ